MPIVDPLSIDFPERSKYLDILNLIKKRKLPSIPIRTQELADVVCGRKDIDLPNWANDKNFESELENLIENYDSVLICNECDYIFGFIAYEPFQQFIMVEELMYVIIRQDLICDYCNKSSSISLCSSEVLKNGKKVDINSEFEVNSKTNITLKKYDNIKFLESPFEKYLDTLLRVHYPFKKEETTKYIRISDDVFEYAKESVSNFKNFTKSLEKLPDVFFLRPIYSPYHLNVLGVVWNSITKLLEKECQYLTKVAIGILPKNQISGWVRLHKKKGFVIILGLGLFKRIYTLNYLMFLLFNSNEKSAIQSLLWLFEYWNTIVNSVSQKTSIVKTRWKNIKDIFASNGYFLSTIYEENVTGFFNNNLNNIE